MDGKMFNVDVCETRKKTVSVRAKNKEEAHRMVQEQWSNDQISLTEKEVSDASFTAYRQKQERSFER